jgi:hypothetical protein
MESYRKTVEGYTQWVNDKIAEGYDPHFVTFMFHQIPGNQDARWLEMTRIIDQVYGRVLSKTFRVPNAAKNQPFMPVLIMFPDFPIYKRDKDHFVDISVNDGQHAQGMGLMPPNSRLEENLSGHFLNHGEKYVRSYPSLQRIHSVRIEETPEKVVRYMFKAMEANRASPDDIAIWPRARTERPTK